MNLLTLLEKKNTKNILKMTTKPTYAHAQDTLKMVFVVARFDRTPTTMELAKARCTPSLGCKGNACGATPDYR